jgi:ABC-2 type transport system ATP-binding protein
VLQPTAGTIRIEDVDLATQRSRALARTNFAAVYAPLPGNLTVYQNLRVLVCMGFRVWLASTREPADTLQPFRHVKCGVSLPRTDTRRNRQAVLMPPPLAAG